MTDVSAEEEEARTCSVSTTFLSAGMHQFPPPRSSKAFRNLGYQERMRIISDNRMHQFCMQCQSMCWFAGKAPALGWEKKDMREGVYLLVRKPYSPTLPFFRSRNHQDNIYFAHFTSSFFFQHFLPFSYFMKDSVG
jgi:hypothetical protein